ncbi:MAG TPA: histidine--tRNA ligase [Candidatus Dojkabacteria bacterium]|nr:histidine--tRNA ligase [Candidatus Dojkabacteria bacterium]HRP51693.1 histidine--tRNA ligase [Candidatus Dojkabacteria bacterium]
MSQSNNYQPRTLQGFNDYFADDVRIRDYVKNLFRTSFQRYGFEPLETPALEYSELMLGQSGEEAEKQYYRFKDNGDRDVMLKFEVMISMCRAIAQSYNEIVFPYKRYQIQNVWRAEKVQKGRYREFTQMDADILGTESMLADAEIIQMGIEVIKMLGFEDFSARISNRKFLEGLAQYYKIDVSKYYGYFMTIDKLEKIGKEAVIEELIERRSIVNQTAIDSIDTLLKGSEITDFKEKIAFFESTIGQTEVGKEALNEITQIIEYLSSVGIDNKYFKFDPSIARGLASYTGPVWEFTVYDGGVGSIAGGGRYDKAIEKYIGKNIPATGISFGLERISDIIKTRNMYNPKNDLKVLVTIFSEEVKNKSIEIANELRSRGIPAMLYPEIAKLEKQFKYADRKDIPYVVVIGPDELSSNTVQLKDMVNRTQSQMNLEELYNTVSLN